MRGLRTRRNQTTTPTEAMARQIQGWTDDEVHVTVYLSNGQWVTSDTWSFGTDGLLSFEGDGGVLHFVNPQHILYAHWGKHKDTEPSLR